MKKRRTERLNSLMREVIDDVIRKNVKNPQIHHLFTITRVEISKDGRHAKVHFSVLGTAEQKKQTLEAFQSAAGFIGTQSSKQIVLRYFPQLSFHLDEGVDRQMNIERLLNEISQERESRPKE